MPLISSVSDRLSRSKPAPSSPKARPTRVLADPRHRLVPRDRRTASSPDPVWRTARSRLVPRLVLAHLLVTEERLDEVHAAHPDAALRPVPRDVVALVLILAIVPSTSPDRTNSFAQGGGDGTGLAAGAGRVGGRTGTSGADSNALGEFGNDGSVATNLQDNPQAILSKEASQGVTGEDCTRRAVLGPSYPCKPLVVRRQRRRYLQRRELRTRSASSGTGPRPTRRSTRCSPAAASRRATKSRTVRSRSTRSTSRSSPRRGAVKVESIVFHGNAETNPTDAAAFRADAVKIDQEVKAAVVSAPATPT